MAKLTVVVPARNAAATLPLTLRALAGGERPPDEVLVADGGSRDGTRTVAERFGARVVDNPRRHAAGARQAGTLAARGEVVAFTDADCIPAPDWLARVERRMDADPELAGVGGRVTLAAPRNRVQAYGAHVFESIMQFADEPVWAAAREMRGSLPGANCAYRRAAVLDVGGFRDEFSNYAEEIDLAWRLLDTGARVLYDPAILVEHLGYPATRRALLRANFRFGIASTKLARHHIRRARIDWMVYRRLLGSIGRLALGREEWGVLPALQSAGFAAGKIYSSIREGIVNL
ncbi:MAG: glycosyltransferase [Longimicrobiaceae bacterium]